MSDMEIDPDENILNKAAVDGSMDYTSWPGLLPAILSRIEKAVHTDFPIPQIPPPRDSARTPSPNLVAPLPSADPVDAPGSSGTTPSSQEINKENANPASISSRTAATNATSSSSILPIPGNLLAQPEPLPRAGLPPQVSALLNEITSTLTLGFANYPPHTIQRLSELVLRPRQHYRHLVSYLHALDRVVHVTSGANIYPLPPAIPDMTAMSVLSNGAGGSGAGLTINSTLANNIGSDEALGGALLTPISWLSRSANGRGSDDTDDTESSSPLSANPVRPQPQLQMQSQQSQSQRHIGSGGRKQEPQLRTESTETIEGPNGMGSIETVTISLGGLTSTGSGTVLTNRGVTQSSEFLREEQRASVTTTNQHVKDQQQPQQAPPTVNPAVGSGEDEDSTMAEGDGAEDEIPHARGPEEIGPQDLGPQASNSSSYNRGSDGNLDVQDIDVEAAVGRRQTTPEKTRLQLESTIPRSPKREATNEFESPATKKRAMEGEEALVEASDDKTEEQAKDSEGDVVIKDSNYPTESCVGVPTLAKDEPDSGSQGKLVSGEVERIRSKTEEEGRDKAMEEIDRSADDEKVTPTTNAVENMVADPEPS